MGGPRHGDRPVSGPPPGRKEPALRFAGSTMAFRLEAAVGSVLREGVTAESLVGQTIEVDGPLGFFRGRVRSAEPYVDSVLGPGHWVVLE